MGFWTNMFNRVDQEQLQNERIAKLESQVKALIGLIDITQESQALANETSSFISKKLVEMLENFKLINEVIDTITPAFKDQGATIKELDVQIEAIIIIINSLTDALFNANVISEDDLKPRMLN